MGTNYYWHESPACATCGREDEDKILHIGKSSAGWAFSLHLHPDEGIRSLVDWMTRFGTPGSTIKDEYGQGRTPGEMIQCIAYRAPRDRPKPASMAGIADSDARIGADGRLYHKWRHEPAPDGLTYTTTEIELT